MMLALRPATDVIIRKIGGRGAGDGLKPGGQNQVGERHSGDCISHQTYATK